MEHSSQFHVPTALPYRKPPIGHRKAGWQTARSIKIIEEWENSVAPAGSRIPYSSGKSLYRLVFCNNEGPCKRVAGLSSKARAISQRAMEVTYIEQHLTS